MNMYFEKCFEFFPSVSCIRCDRFVDCRLGSMSVSWFYCHFDVVGTNVGSFLAWLFWYLLLALLRVSVSLSVSLSVCLSVRLSVTILCCIKTS